MNLRPYQLEALGATRSRRDAGVTRQCVVLPTGTGKAVILASLPSALGLQKRMLILVHREELAEQALDKVLRWNPGINAGIEMADRHAGFYDQIVVASVPTIGRTGSARIGKFSPEDFECVVTDECHHSTASTYRNIYEHFGVMQPGGRLHVGFTATPNRSDGSGLGQIFDEIVYQMSLRKAIEDGWLSDIRATRVFSRTSLDDVHTNRGDFNTGELEDAVNNDERNRLIVSAYKEYASARKTICFCVDVQHAKDVAEHFRSAGVNAQAVWGEDPSRAEKMAGYRKREFDVLTNCGIATEGFDDPMTDCVLLARPTKSKLLLAQMLGRGTRIEPGVDNRIEHVARGGVLAKPDCLVLDITDNTTRHSLAGVGSLVGLSDKLDLKGGSLVKWAKKFEEAAQEHPHLDTSTIKCVDDLEVAARSVDLFRDVQPEAIASFATMTWAQRGNGAFSISLPGKGSAELRQNLIGHWELGIIKPDIGDRANALPDKLNQHDDAMKVIEATPVPSQFSSLPDAIGWTERLLKRAGYGHLLGADSGWRRDKPSEAQLRFARKLRIAVPETATKGEVSRAIDAALAARSGR